MNSIMDVVLAMVITGMLILFVMQIEFNTKSHAITLRQNLETQENLHLVSKILEYDLRKIGHNLWTPSRAIHFADSSRIIFSYNKNYHHIYDSIRVDYRIEPSRSSRNPHDYTLLRKENNAMDNRINLGLSRFRLNYFNQYNTQLPTPVISDSLSKIREIEVLLIVENEEGFDNQFARAAYNTRLTPKNLLIEYGR
ncbi:hypothetical protein GF407_18880 [candidate division KSB1 bacterium]|nr:hypothetical protein [candidate division KSB1 bacterium]